MKFILSALLLLYSLPAAAEGVAALPDTPQPQAAANAAPDTAPYAGSATETQQTTETEAAADTQTPPEETTPETETEPVVYAEEEVFPPEFMKKLLACRPSVREDGERKLEVKGLADGKCRLHYADFTLNLPAALLGNIHSFADIETLLKNKDIAVYDGSASYTYDGLMYALDACFNKTNRYGDEKIASDGYVETTSSLNAEYVSGICKIYLDLKQDTEGAVTDNGVTCTLPYKAVEALEEYIKDLVAAYGEQRTFSGGRMIITRREQQNKQTHEADIALMYYLQQNGYCRKN